MGFTRQFSCGHGGFTDVGVAQAYAADLDAVFFLRKYQSAPGKDWNAIRRGFIMTSRGYHARVVQRQMMPDERQYLISHFIRLASPINYFLVPKQANERDACGGNIGEYKPLLEYVALRFRARYGSALQEFARAADAPTNLIAGRDVSGSSIKITHRSNKHDFEDASSKRVSGRKASTKHQDKRRDISSGKVSVEQLHEMARLYLEQSVSFRNLERRVLGIDSQARGGGFIAKSALNDLGITASEKGMLSRMTPEAAIQASTGRLQAALREVYGVG